MAPRSRSLVIVLLSVLAALPPTVGASHTEPQAFAVTPGENRLILTWSAPSSGTPDAYRIYVTSEGNALLADLPPTTTRYVDKPLADGWTRSYAVAAVWGGVEERTSSRSATTFAPSAIAVSNFTTGADGFATERSGGGAHVGWQAAARALVIGYSGASTSSDDVISRALPGLTTDHDGAFEVRATLSRPYDGWGAAVWPLVLTNPGSTDIETRASTIGIRLIEPPGPTVDEEYYAQMWYRDASGALHESTEFFTWECSPDCVDHPTTWDLTIAYDPDARRISWRVSDRDGPTYSWSYSIGTTAGDGFSVSEIAVASDRPGGRSVTFTVDDLHQSWKRSETPPTRPLALTAARPGIGQVDLAWTPPLDTGSEPVTGYEVRRDGSLIATPTTPSHTDTGSARWAYHTYEVRAINGFATGPASGPREVVPMPSRHAEVAGFETAPMSWKHRHQIVACCQFSDVDVFESQGEAAVSFGATSYHQYAAPLEGRPWTEDTGSFAVETVWYDWGSGRQTGACLLALVPEGQVSCQGAGTIAGELRAENRSGSSPARARLRFTDAGNVDRILVSHPVTPNTLYRMNATYDLPTRTLTLRLKSATGALLASGSYTIANASDGFRIGHAGIVAGIGAHGSSPDYGVARVDSLSFTFDAPQPPGLPSPPDLTATATGVGEVSLAWTAPADPGAAPVSEYLVYRTGPNERRTFLTRTPGTSFVDAGLHQATTFTYQVSARNTVGEGTLSTAAPVRTWGPPGAVSWLRAATGPGAGQVTLAWEPPAADPAGAPTEAIRVTRDGSLLATLGADATGFLDSGLLEGASHTYRVYALSPGGAGPESSVRGVAPSRPTAPRTPVATPGPGVGEITLRWSAPFNTGGIPVDYVVRRSLEDAPFAVVAEPGAATEWRDTGLATGANVTYTVTARNAVGEGAPSLAAPARAPSGPSAPLNLSAIRGPGAGEIRLAWKAPIDTGGIALTGYRVYRNGAAIANASSTSFKDTGLAAGSVNAYEIAAVNAAGEGARAGITITAPDVPAAPGALTATTGPTLGRITLTWSAPATDGGLAVTGYRVYRDGGLAASLGVVTSFADSGLPDDATFSYRVVAVNAVGEGANATATGRTWARVAPGAVTGLTARNAGLGLIRVEWAAPAPNAGQPAREYHVYRVGGLAGETLAATVDAANTTFLDSPTRWGLQAAPEYEYRVVAVNDVGEGPFRTSPRASPLR